MYFSLPIVHGVNVTINNLCKINVSKAIFVINSLTFQP